MADRHLHLIRSRLVKGEGLIQNRSPLVDFCPIPAAVVLFVEQDARLGAPRRGQQGDQHAAQADFLF